MLDNNILLLVVALGSILISMTFHEAMHAFTGNWLGDDTAKLQGRLTLNPLKHIDPIFTVAVPLLLALSGGPIFGAAKPVPFNPYRVRFGEYGAALVGIAGPLTNLMLALAMAGVVRIFGVGLPETFLQAAVVFIQVNVGFFVFNMIPFPPLDGSRLLYAFAPEGLQNLMRQIESYGLMSIAIFMFLLFPTISPIISSIMNSILRFMLL